MVKREGEFFFYVYHIRHDVAITIPISLAMMCRFWILKKLKKTKQNQKKVSWLTYCSKVFILDLLPFEDYTFIWENQMIGLV